MGAPWQGNCVGRMQAAARGRVWCLPAFLLAIGFYHVHGLPATRHAHTGLQRFTSLSCSGGLAGSAAAAATAARLQPGPRHAHRGAAGRSRHRPPAIQPGRSHCSIRGRRWCAGGGWDGAWLCTCALVVHCKHPVYTTWASYVALLGRPNLAIRAEFRGALAAALGTEALLHSFLAVRRSEWEHFGEAPLETEAALLYARY